MKKIVLIALMALAPLMAQVEGKIEVPYIDFPVKMGKGFNTIQANCLMCHSFGYILNQGTQSRAKWHKVIHKMRHHFKAPINDADAKIIEDYLTEYYGNGK